MIVTIAPSAALIRCPTVVKSGSHPNQSASASGQTTTNAAHGSHARRGSSTVTAASAACAP